jgi:hypothetical protein
MGYSELVSYYDENKNKPFNHWLEFDGYLPSQGKQGLIGLFKRKDVGATGTRIFYKKKNKPGYIVGYDNMTNSYDIQLDGSDNIISTTSDRFDIIDVSDNSKFIFKLSQYTNHLAQHEMNIMKGLSTISSYCPHFCRGYGIITTSIEPNFRKSKNPFEITSKYPIDKDIMLCEHVNNATKFYNYIKTESIHEDVLFSIVKQTLLAIAIAQKEKQFTHYDLHSNNIMVKRCDKDLVFLYRLDEDNQFCVPTLGYYSVIIDYGFSYIKDLENTPLFSSMCHTDVGFTSNRFDWVSDPKLFLVTVSGEIKDIRRTKKAKTFRRIVKNIFSKLKIDWESGWDVLEKKGAVDYVANILETYNTNSKLFDTCDFYCLDLLQTLIILPLEKQDYTNIRVAYETFLGEWVKIENQISSEFYNLYILKEIIDIARNIRPKYSRRETREHAVSLFKKHVYAKLSTISAFCVPKEIHFEKMLCSLYQLSKNIEGMLFDIVSAQNVRKQVYYDKMLLSSVEQVFAAVNINISDSYVYSKDTTVMVIDNVLKKKYSRKIPIIEIDNVNALTHLARGTYINDLICK